MAKFKLEEHVIKFYLRYIAFCKRTNFAFSLCKRTNFAFSQSTLNIIRIIRYSISEIK